MIINMALFRLNSGHKLQSKILVFAIDEVTQILKQCPIKCFLTVAYKDFTLQTRQRCIINSIPVMSSLGARTGYSQ